MGINSPGVNAVPKANQDVNFETISVTVDSGAFNTVGPPTIGTHFKITPAEASAKGRHYSAASGSVIRNYGERVITGTKTNLGYRPASPSKWVTCRRY